MFGEYKGTAKLDNNVDSSGFNALAPGEAFNEWTELGSIKDLRFQLVKTSQNNPRPTSVPSGSTPDDEPLAPLVPVDEPLAPLVPKDEPLAPLDPTRDVTMGKAEGAWIWDYHNQALFYGEAGSTTPVDEDVSDSLPYVLRVYPGGVVSIYLDIVTKYFTGRPQYNGRIAKKVTLVDIT